MTWHYLWRGHENYRTTHYQPEDPPNGCGQVPNGRTNYYVHGTCTGVWTMTATREKDDSNSEMAFVVLMLVLSVIIFLVIRNSERSDSGEP